MEIFAYLAELIMERIASSSSSTNLSGKQPSIDFKKWRLVFSQVKELILVALTQAECVRHSVSCLKVMAKLKLFEDTKVDRKRGRVLYNHS